MTTKLSTLHAPPFHFLFIHSAGIPLRGYVVTRAAWHSPPTQNPVSTLFRSFSEGFLVCDLNRRRWIGRFTQPSDGLYTSVVASPDGRFFVANGFLRNSKGAGGRYQYELLIYDLRSLPHDLPDRRELLPAGLDE